ncbi:hypothetical protein [Desulfothermus sp.]
MGVKYAFFYPKEYPLKGDALFKEPALTFKLEVLVAGFKHSCPVKKDIYSFIIEQRNTYFVGINGSPIDLQNEIGRLIPSNNLIFINKLKSGQYSWIVVVHLITPLDVFAELSKTSGSAELFTQDQIERINWHNKRLNKKFNLCEEIKKQFNHITKPSGPVPIKKDTTISIRRYFEDNIDKILEEGGDMEKGIPPTIRQAYYVFVLPPMEGQDSPRR